MTTFDKSKVISGANAEQAEVGKKYWCSNYIGYLKDYVKNDNYEHVNILASVQDIERENAPFIDTDGADWEFIYPYDESLDQEKNKVIASLKDSISEFMNQKIYELQNVLNITNGDIHFEMQTKWDTLIEKTTEEWCDMFMEVLKWQKK